MLGIAAVSVVLAYIGIKHINKRKSESYRSNPNFTNTQQNSYIPKNEIHTNKNIKYITIRCRNCGHMMKIERGKDSICVTCSQCGKNHIFNT